LEKGSLVLIDLSGRVKETGEVIETNVEADAKKFGVFDEAKKYEPRLVAVGEDWVLKGLDEAIISAKLNKRVVIDISPEKAFGARDPNKVRRIPLRKLGEKAADLRVGDEVEIDNRIGLVRFIGSGRTQLDFNHRYAGKVLTYDFKITKKLETDYEKTMSLLRRRLPIEEGKISLNIKNDEITISIPQEAYLTEGLQIIKKAASTDIFKYIENVNKVTYLEIYESQKPKKTKITAKKKTKSKQAQPLPKTAKKKTKSKQAQPLPKTVKSK
jgi:peptidylprolyl isomerase|tara:strand:+ start:726 stop:1535 length:810 start_codon:yes stop_codon:yes gene_type:complete